MTNPKILLIDDSFVTRLKVRNVLKLLCEFEFSEASNGEDGLKQIETNNFDLIVLDLLMPKMDGFQVLKELKRNNKKEKIIVLSADIQITTRNKCLQMGALAVLPKSVSLSELTEIVKSTFNL